MKCAWHCCIRPVVVIKQKNKIYCSAACKVKAAVTKKRRENKRRAVELLGGKCIRCGYSRSVWALHFHHITGNKEFSISRYGNTWGWLRIVEELKKCELVCANCHAESHEMELFTGIAKADETSC